MDEVICGDCVVEMRKMPEASFDLGVCDPPWGINYEYDIYKDTLEYQEYVDWSKSWLTEVKRLLKPTGSLWVYVGDSFVSELDIICKKDLGLYRRSWVVHHFSFGANCKRKFTPSHAHLLYYTKSPKDFTFNEEAIRVPSSRQLVYADKRANANGRLPNDVWALRPQEEEKLFQPDSDTWFVPRVCGTFKERCAWHPCQMAESVVDRIIRTSSNPGDRILDCFAGSGTSLVVAKRLDREYLGIELSENYCKGIIERLGKEAN